MRDSHAGSEPIPPTDSHLNSPTATEGTRTDETPSTDVAQRTLGVAEIFFSIQGEGARAGEASIFIRLQGCSAKHACYASGIRCDTEFESGRTMTVAEILGCVKELAPKCRWIIWTGGEPTDQLTDEIADYFADAEYYQAIETSGLHPVPEAIDWVCVSPKVAEHVIKKNFPTGVDELRYVRHKGQSIPQPSVEATCKFISPHFDGNALNEENLRHCIDLVKQNPEWALSLQLHKLIGVL